MEPDNRPTQNKWQPWQVEQLKKLVSQGITQKEIAAQLGVTKNAVNGKVKGLGLAKKRMALQAYAIKPEEPQGRPIGHPWKPGDPKPDIKI